MSGTKYDNRILFSVEDPSEECQYLRDYVDVSNCAKLSGWSKENLLQGFTPELEQEVYRELKLCKVSFFL